MRLQIFFIFFLLFIGAGIPQSYSQLNQVDSLKAELSGENDMYRQVELLCKLSDLHLNNNPDLGFQYASEAVAISEKTGDRKLLSESYTMLGVCYQDKGNYDSSMYFLDKAMRYADVTERCAISFQRGQNIWFNGAYKDAIHTYHEAEACALENKNYHILAVIWYSMAEYYRYEEQDSLAQQYVERSVKILEKLHDTRDLSVACNIQAEIYRNKGEYTKALDAYIRTAQLAYRNLDSNRIGYCLSRMGYICYMQGKYPQAEEYLLRSLDISRNVKSRNLELFILECLTDMYSRLDEEQKCRYYAGLTLQKGKEANDPSAEAVVTSSLSSLYFHTQQYDSAMVYADRSYRIANANGDHTDMLNAILNKLPVLDHYKKYAEVISLTSEGIGFAAVTGTLEHLKDLYRYRYMAMENTGRYKEAFVAYKNFIRYQDTLSNTTVITSVNRGELELAYQDKHLSDTLAYIETTQKNRQELLLQKQRSNYFILIGSVTAVFLLCIVMILWSAHKRQKKLNAHLAESNNEKELLLKEIHHRVKNNLQVVSSLLNLQKNQSSGKNFEELISDSQLKISNIAIVHELLYQSTTFKKINLSEYIDKLTRYTLDTYRHDRLGIEIRKEIDNIDIPLDKSVPLALIINEIITNSVKYAFTGREKGKIEIICEKQTGRVQVTIRDDGKGMPDEADHVGKGIGLSLIKGFIRQLNGEIRWGNDNGCFFVFSFPYST